MNRIATTLIATMLASLAAPVVADNTALADAIAGDWRTPTNVERDRFRHPQETLEFFGVQPGDTVVEIIPGGGWYTEILGPYLRDEGKYIGATWDETLPGARSYYARLNDGLRARLAGAPEVYGTAEIRTYDPAQPAFGPAGSADAVLTFRNVHNWVADDNAGEYFSAFFDVLAPGGTLGVVDHRATPGTALETMKKSGYLTEALVVQLATDAGFVLEAIPGMGKDVALTPDFLQHTLLELIWKDKLGIPDAVEVYVPNSANDFSRMGIRGTATLTPRLRLSVDASYNIRGKRGFSKTLVLEGEF